MAKIQARIVGPEAELGEVRAPLEIFGNPLTREFSEIEVTPEQFKKLQGNRYVELKGAAPDEATPGAQERNDTDTSIKARLDELGVEYSANASPKTLQGLLNKAEAAKARADEEEAEILAQAEEIRGEHS